MAVVRLEALSQLAKAITCEIPELVGQVCVGQANALHRREFPHLMLDPGRWTYSPQQALEHHEPAPNAVVMNVGHHQAEVTIRVGAATLYERYSLEQQILDLFLATPLHPGVLETQVTACEALGDFTASWELESDEWRDEMAFDSEFYSWIVVTGTIPALVTRRGVYTIEQLQLGLHLTPTPGVLPDTFAPPEVEVVLVNSDGTLSPAP